MIVGPFSLSKENSGALLASGAKSIGEEVCYEPCFWGI
jgi:hypothetical protein